MRVLSIDGGGIRGLIPALVLAEIEERSGKRIWRALRPHRRDLDGRHPRLRPRAPDPLPAEQLVGLDQDEGPNIFDRSVWQRIRSAEGLLDEKYDAAALDRALERFLSDKRLAETKPDLLIPAYNMGDPGPYFFKSRKAREEGEDYALSQVARATSAAPTYFEPFQPGRPGAGRRRGVRRPIRRCAPSPRSCASSRRGPAPALARHRPADPQAELRRGQELGPGRVGQADPRRRLRRRSDAVDYQLQHVLEEGHYWRLQVELTQASDELDNASVENLADLRAAGRAADRRPLRGHRRRNRSAPLGGPSAAAEPAAWVKRRGRCRPGRGAARARRDDTPSGTP